METVFDLRDVSYTYLRRFEALKGVTMAVQAGEQVAILGANGSGKSTLLAILNALSYPTSGEFYAFGTLVKEEIFDTLEDNEFNRSFRKKVGFLFQNPDIQLFSSTVFDEIAFGPLQLDLPPDEVQKRTEEVIAMLGIENLQDRAPHMLSGGEKKKVCIASILSTNPDVLLLDEPTGGLDPRSQIWLIELIQDLAKCGKTIITATHDLDIVEQISTRAIVVGEDHTIKLDSDCASVMGNLDLLMAANLIHRHIHRHGKLLHEHLHAHTQEHDHVHGPSVV
ncbi:energy-coupling factor ABC transporter ATP-binding protein [Methanoregula sp.]|jgi:cobalt/nickel transport system ATP-binding protein|uniref:energy-coupling factor ABC transporter ATP-binding protein n=1 Tax=Methanoregula sp. TaxID=2052170 RepID=UPI0025F80D5A|nr:ATP-binding cassette domain-containing protein [Methanoregula sp.]